MSDHGQEHDTIAQKFLDILGPEDASLNFVLQFNEKLCHKEADVVPKKTTPAPAPAPIKVISKSSEPKPVRPAASKDVPKPLEPLKMQDSGPTRLPRRTVVKADTKPKKSSKMKKLKSLEEIDNVLKTLELEQSEADPAKYTCNCQGNRHPLFEVAPNCLSCGKIICAREGLNLNNCTFCGEPFLSEEDRAKIIDVLNQEKLDLASSKPAPVAEKPKRARGYKITSGAGTNLFSEQDKMFDRVEKEKQRELKRAEVLRGMEEEQAKHSLDVDDQNTKDPELRSAQERLERLLHFQDTSAQRTKIIDNASDFSMSDDANIWGSAQDRVLMLKRQQRNARRWEKLEKERHGRRDKVVMDLSIGKDGKVTLTEASRPPKTAHAGDEENVDEISDEEDLEDLQAISELNENLLEKKKKNDRALESNVWDPEKDKKQFQKPIYMGHTRPADETSSTQENKERGWKNRVQITQGDENSLEQNILAVL